MTHLEIAPGDVLLFHGRGFVSWAIRKFDGTEVNHAAIALGDGKLAEAAGHGLQRASLDDALQNNDFTIVRRLKDKTLDDVVAVANRYVTESRPYAYQQIVLLALLATTRKIPLPPIGRRLVRSALDHAAAALNAFLDRQGTRSMICSEFVYRCYDEAPGGPPPPYHLGILLGGVAFGGPNGSLVDWALSKPDEELPETPAASFGAKTAIDPSAYDEVAEANLAPLIDAYARETGLADDDMPSATAAPSFGVDSIEDVSDDELLSSLAGFGSALAEDQAAPAAFGVGTVLGTAAVRGAIEGIRRVSVDANFVTPGDLLRSPSLTEIGRVRNE